MTREEIAGELHGWSPPVIYDIHIDRYRVATQKDIDDLLEIMGRYGALRRVMQEEDEWHKQRLARK